VPDHHARRSRREASVGGEVAALQLFEAASDRGKLEVRVDRGAAESREVLEAAGDPRALQTVQITAGETSHRLGVDAERTVADGVGRAGLAEVDHRREIHVESEGFQGPGREAGEALDGVVAATAQVYRRGGGADPRLESAHGTAFLIDGEQDRAGYQLVEMCPELGERLRGVEIASEQDDAARVQIANSSGRSSVQGDTVEADHQRPRRGPGPIRRSIPHLRSIADFKIGCASRLTAVY